MKVREIMTTPAVTVDGSTPVVQTARILYENHLAGVPVIDAAGRVIGVVTEADLIVRNANLHLPRFLTFLDALVPTGGAHEYEEEIRRVLATTAEEVMSDEVANVGPDDDVSDAATIIMDSGINPLPVIEDGRLVGTISRTDIVHLMLLEEEEATGHLVQSE